MNSKFDLSWDTCLPNPHEPDFKRYANIGICIVICWVTVVLEPYALRVRQVIMRRHYPDRAKERAAWLVNHILRHRKNFVKKARRDMRRKYKKDTVMDNIDDEPLWHRLRKFIICLRCFDICLGWVMLDYYVPEQNYTFSISFQLLLQNLQVHQEEYHQENIQREKKALLYVVRQNTKRVSALN